MSHVFDHDPFIHPPLAAEQRERLRAEGVSGPAERELSFGQFLDAVNPLHHIPVVGTLYRELTGDTIDSASSVVGSVIYGGPVGLVAGLVNAVVEESSGRNLGGNALAMVTGDEPAGAEPALAKVPMQEERQMASAGAAKDVSPAAMPAAATSQARPSPEQGLPQDVSSARVLEGDDALAALAADLRAAASRGAVPRSDEVARVEAAAAARELEAPPAASGIPPRDSFMPLSATAFSGPRLATDIKAEHAHRSGSLGPGGLFPASLGAVAARAESGSAADEKAPEDEPAESKARIPGAAGPALPSAAGLIAPGLQADQRFAAQIAPGANFADRMTEALNKYRALSEAR